MIVVDTDARALTFGQRRFPCTIGRGGAVPEAAKREGDGATPTGNYRLVGALLRPDRISAPITALPWRWLRPDDGWSDDPADPQYNRSVLHPHGFSAERLWRDDGVYDVIVVLNHNSNPVVPGFGSAVFWHLIRNDARPTEGCIAIERAAMLGMLPALRAGMEFRVSPA